MISLNDESHIEEHHITLLIEKLDKIAKSDLINSDEHHDVSNELINNGSSEKEILINNFVNCLDNTETNNQEAHYSPNKILVSKEGSQNIEEKSNNVLNDVSDCIPQIVKTNTSSTANNNDVENNHQLIRTLSSENLAIAENSKDKEVEEDSSIIKNIENCENNDSQLCKDNNAQTSTESIDEIQSIENVLEHFNEIESEVLNLISDNEELIESDNGSGGSSVIFDGFETNRESHYKDEISKESTSQQSMKNLATQILFEMFSEKNNIYEVRHYF